MEAPKCKSCGKNHWERICPDIFKAAIKENPDDVIEILSAPEPTSRDGYNAFMRDYMRKKRLKDKDKLK